VPELSFAVEGAEAVKFAAAPLLAFKLRVSNAVAAEPIYSVALRCQSMIETTRRRYNRQESTRLFDLFGRPEDYHRTLRSMLWTFTNVNVPAFVESTLVDLPVPCTYDFNVAAAKYFYALEDGEVPLSLLFSGTVFYEAGEANLQVGQSPWEKEAAFRLPVRAWKEMMDHYYPNSARLCLHRDLFDRLYLYKIRHGLTSWEAVLENLLPQEEEEGRPA
jgi:hypothetical protein